MNRWKSNFGLLLGIALIVSHFNTGFCENVRAVRIASNAGIIAFDHNLSFEASPSFGLGASLILNRALQLDLSGSFSPTQQRFQQAAFVNKAKFSVYQYALSLKVKPGFARLGSLQPYLGVAAGGLIIDPHRTTLDLGTGRREVEADVEHFFLAGVMVGVSFALTRELALDLGFRHGQFHSNEQLSATQWAQINTLEVGISVVL